MPRCLLFVVTCTIFIQFIACKQTPETEKPDFLAANIDSTVNPGDDFFMYANGGWIKKTPIPAAESGWSIGNLVQEEIYNRLRKINEDAMKSNASENATNQKIGDFWYSGMDTVSIDKEKLGPLTADFQRINAIAGTDDIIRVAGALHRKGIDVLFSDYIGQDDKNSEAMVYQLFQGGLGMPNRDYYFNTDERTLGVKKAYREMMHKLFMQIGYDSIGSAKISGDVFQLETKLAKASRKLADLRDPYRNYNMMYMPALNKLTSNLSWPVYLRALGINKIDSAIVGQPEFYTALNNELKATPITTWKNYLQFHLVFRSAPYLDKQTFQDYFEYTQSLTGATEPRPRWKRVLDAEEGAVGEALGQLFVKEYFNDTAKKRYNNLVEAIRGAYKERIKNLSWMSDSTKQKAYEKLASINKKVGYPDKWKDFSALKIDRGPFVLNVQRANEWWSEYLIKKLGKPVDRTEWSMSPQTYNAYYNASNNEIVLPAGIFTVPGMRDEDLDDAFVYGYAAASTIGHEITHGFDDQGRQYNAQGNLVNWWQQSDSLQFSQRAKKIIRQFSEFNPVDTLHVNGDATQGENIADLGGLLLGLDAFKKTESYKKGEKIGGLTPLQRYFLGYSYGWMSQSKKERLANQVMSDVHAPAKERVNGPMVNIPEFYEAFGIKSNNKMYRADSLRVRIW